MRSKLYGASYLKFMYSPVVKVVTSIGGCCVAPAKVYSVKITSESMDFPESGNASSPPSLTVQTPSPPSLTVQAPSPPSLTVQAPSPPSLTVQTSDDKSRAVNLLIPESEIEILSSLHLKAFLFSELKNATTNFYFDNLLGEGGFGYVYQGWLDEKTLTAAKPECGMIVAVKKLKPEGFQGHKEWLSELNYLGQLHHPNLVKLIGYCLDGDNRLLVYEFMPRGSLENHIFKRCAKPLQWATRIKVAIGAARGLLFLHDSESQVIYRDFKASNILLDSDFNAKLSDFGLAKAGPTGDHTHVTTRVMGTHGYAAPEYVATGRLTAKCDVYSFGIVLLELLTGRRAIDKTSHGAEQKLVDWVRSHFTDKRKVFRVMDTKLEGQYPRKGAFMAVALAIHCTHINPKYRPSMDEVLAILEKLPSPKFMNMPPRSTQSRPMSEASQHDHSLHMKSTHRGCPSPLPAHMKSQHDQSS